MPQPVRLVLDTNIVLDWLVFEELDLAPLRDVIRARRVIVLANALIGEEVHRVLAYPTLSLSALRQSEVLSRYRTWATFVAMPQGFAANTLLLPPGFPRCRDPDDDVFTALAYHGRADGLVTRDKALLRLRRRAAKFGLPILHKSELLDYLAGAASGR